MQDLAFAYDPASNIVSVTDAVSPPRSETFQYDLVGRLIEASGVYGTIAVTYDKVGNREFLSWDQGGSVYGETYGYGAGSHRLTQVAAGGGTRVMGYDAAGALVIDEKNGTTYAYIHDGAGRLIEARNGTAAFASYAYDAFEQRVLKTTTAAAPGGASSVHFIHDQFGRLIAEHDGATGAVLREYIWLGLLPVAYVDHSSGTPALYYVLADQVGEPQKLTDASGAVVWDRVATPFGQEVSVTGSLTQPLRFPGQRHDQETGFAQNWHRDYDPRLGRYIQSDPIGLMGGISTYGYVGGNPGRYVDPTGECPACWGFAIGFALDVAIQLYQNDGNLRCVNWWQSAGAGAVGAIGANGFKWTNAGRGLGTNPFKGKRPDQIAEMFKAKGFTPKGPDPISGRGTFVNPKTGRGYHIDASHPAAKGPHVGAHRPRPLRDTRPPRDYPLE